MAEVEDEIINAGAQIIWVLEQDSRSNPGTPRACRDWVNSLGSSAGLCVGDAETQPIARVFDRAPFAKGRGFDLIVRRSTMVIEFVSTHGTPAGNDNLTGQQLLERIRAL